MITVEEATQLIKQHIGAAPVVPCSTYDVRDTFLAEDLLADRPLPPFDRVAMDGIAINLEATQLGFRRQMRFLVLACQAAGEPQKTLPRDKLKSHCLEVMTGAPLPANCDVVIPYEELSKSIDAMGQVSFALDEGCDLKPFQNVHREGIDRLLGDVVLSRGQRLRAPQWGIAAAFGKATVMAPIKPRIALVTTGDELVDIEVQPEPHQIRNSNSIAMLASLCQHHMGHCQRFHLPDDAQVTFETLQGLLPEFDVILLSGGVSMGTFDYVPQAIKDLGVKEIFHKVRQRPGKPLWFGMGPRGQIVFGLPGNPISTMVTMHRYVIPALKYWQHKNMTSEEPQIWPPMYAKLGGTEIVFDKPMAYFVPVKMRFQDDASLLATPIDNNGSGDFAALASADGFIELPAGRTRFQPGEVFPCFPC